MKKTTYLIIAFCFLLFSYKAEAQTSVIDLASQQQYIRGFGGANIVAWTGDLTAAQRTTAFSTTSGIGLSIVRVRVPVSSSGFAAEKATIDACKSYGGSAIASAWSAPASMKTNGSTVGGKLSTSSYAAYAAHLKAFNTAVGGVLAISPTNEPNYAVSYESMNMTASEVAAFVAAQGKNCGAEIMGPEPFNMDQTYINTYLSNAAAKTNTSFVCGHIYGKTPYSFSPGKEIFMTEHYTSSTASGNDWANAMNAAKEINDCMNVGWNMYVYWYIRRSYGPMDESGNITKLGYVMAQYSRYVRPGFNKVSATYNPTSGVYITAYKNGTNVVIVALNQNSSSKNITFTLQNGSVASFTKYTTSSSKNVSNGGSVSVTNGSCTSTLDASSITTFVSSGTVTPTLAVSPVAVNIAAAANSTGTFNITSNTSWTVASSQSWLTVSPATGSNNAAVTVTAQENTIASARSATVTITGTGVTAQTVIVTQNAAGSTSTLAVSPTTLSVAAAASSTGTFAVTSNTAWTVSSSQSWLTVSPASGSNNATVTLTAQQNISTSARSATVTIAGTGVTSQTVTVTQDAAPGSGSTNVYLEAECGTVGSLWSVQSGPTASNTAFTTVVAGNNATASAPANASGWITYPFTVSTAGTYSVWLRTVCPDANGDSFWLKMDDGSFVRWNGITVSTAWTWFKYTATYSLTAGTHTFTIGFSEDGAKLDKIFITSSATTPSGTGSTAVNLCAPLLKSAKVEEVETAVNNTGELGLYPNPVSSTLHVTLSGSPSTISLYNSGGQQVLNMNTEKTSITIDMAKYLPGVYFIKITNANQTITKKILKQ